MIQLPDTTINEIKLHAEKEYPRESCGVVIVVKGKYRYIACRNIADNDLHFIINPEDWSKAEDIGTPVLIVHSHPNIPPIPSQADLVSCELTGLPWLIINWPTGALYQFEPEGYKAPLIGREFSHGILDCFTLIQDYYYEELGIRLETPYREDKWWEKGQNLYLDNAAKWGFIEVSEPKKHDVLLMQVASSVPNHGVIWLGDGNIMQHQTGRLSSRDVYGGWYRKITTHIFRHKELMS